MAKTKGIDSGRVAVFKSDDSEQIDTAMTALGTEGVYTIDEKTAEGITVGNITGLAPTMTKIYGSDMVVETSGKGTSGATATLGANDIPETVIDALTGVEENSNGISVITSNTRPPYSVLEFITHNRQEDLVHFALLKGTFGLEDHSMATNTNTEQLAVDSMTFTAVNRQSDKAVYAKVSEGNAKFNQAAWDSFLFPGTHLTTTTTTTV